MNIFGYNLSVWDIVHIYLNIAGIIMIVYFGLSLIIIVKQIRIMGDCDSQRSRRLFLLDATQHILSGLLAPLFWPSLVLEVSVYIVNKCNDGVNYLYDKTEYICYMPVYKIVEKVTYGYYWSKYEKEDSQ